MASDSQGAGGRITIQNAARTQRAAQDEQRLHDLRRLRRVRDCAVRDPAGNLIRIQERP